ncbi:MAG: hypothetical protein ABI972_04105 [Acidobacteriota bacterium]
MLLRPLTLLAITLSAAAQSQSGSEQEFAAAMRLIGDGDFPQAERKLRALEKAHPGLIEVRYRLGLVLSPRKKFWLCSPPQIWNYYPNSQSHTIPGENDFTSGLQRDFIPA